MDKVAKTAKPKEKKPYTAPKLTTHGDVAKLTKGQDDQGQDEGSHIFVRS
jgi:hypothetical protein